MKIEITIGWTQSDMANGYSSYDGWRPGAAQHTEVVEVNVHPDVAASVPEAAYRITEAAFEATNSPAPLDPVSLAGQIRDALTARGFNGSQSGHYSLSVGDTVSFGEVTFACEPVGWKQVSLLEVPT